MFLRIAALLNAPQPPLAAEFTSVVLHAVLAGAPARVAQAVASADALLPAIVRRCGTRGVGPTNLTRALVMLIDCERSLAARARSLGALEAALLSLQTCADTQTPGGGGDGGGGDAAEAALRLAAQLCALTVHTAAELRALAETPGLLPLAARWLKRGSHRNARAAAVLLLTSIDAHHGISDDDDKAAADAVAAAVLSRPGVLWATADAVADAAAFGPDTCAVMASAGDLVVRRGAEAADRTPGFLDGVAAMLEAHHPPPAAAADLWLAPCARVAQAVCLSSANLGSLLRLLAEQRPTRRLFRARLRFVAALDARAALAEQWAAVAAAAAAANADAGDADVDNPGTREIVAPTEKEFGGVVALLVAAKDALLRLREADLVAAADGGSQPASSAAAVAAVAAVAAATTAVGGSAGSGNGGGGSSGGEGSGGGTAATSSAARPSDVHATTAAGKPVRRCCACGREDGGGTSGAALLQCAGCKGTGLKAFFCDRACLKAGWKAHKPACKAAQRQRDGGG